MSEKLAGQAAKIFVVHNQKGGVGKSSTSVNTALFASQVYRLKTLFIDIDAQKNSTNSLCSSVPRKCMVASMLFGDSLPDDILPMNINEKLDLIPGDKALKGIDSVVGFNDRTGRRALYEAFRDNVRKMAEGYDLVIIDTPTTAELRYMAALAAADYCLSPTTLDAYGMEGIADTKETLREIRSIYGNPKLKDMGMMPNKVEPRSKLHAANIEQLRQAGIRVFSEIVYRRIDVENKLNLGKRSPVMRPAVHEILTQMELV